MWKCSVALCWHTCKGGVCRDGSSETWRIWPRYHLYFQRDSVAWHWIFICMAQAITGHGGALAGRSISYYSMKLPFSLQTSVALPPSEGGGLRGGCWLLWVRQRIGAEVTALREKTSLKKCVRAFLGSETSANSAPCVSWMHLETEFPCAEDIQRKSADLHQTGVNWFFFFLKKKVWKQNSVVTCEAALNV